MAEAEGRYCCRFNLLFDVIPDFFELGFDLSPQYSSLTLLAIYFALYFQCHYEARQWQINEFFGRHSLKLLKAHPQYF